MKLFTTDKTLKDAIKRVLKAGKDWQKDLQACLISATLHCVKHGDNTYINELFNGTTTLCHNNSVSIWFDKYAPVKWDSKSKSFKTDKEKAAKAKANVAKATEDLKNSKPYYDMVKVTPPFQGFDLNAKIAALVKEADAYAKGVYAKGERKDEEMTAADKEKVKNNTATARNSLKKLIGESTVALH